MRPTTEPTPRGLMSECSKPVITTVTRTPTHAMRTALVFGSSVRAHFCIGEDFRPNNPPISSGLSGLSLSVIVLPRSAPGQDQYRPARTWQLHPRDISSTLGRGVLRPILDILPNSPGGCSASSAEF